MKYLPVRQDLFDGIVDAKGMKTRGSTETVRAILIMITNKNRPKELGQQEKQICRRFFKNSQLKGIQIYSTLSETKAAFAERTIRSLKNKLYRYLDYFGYKYIHELFQFVTNLNPQKNCSRDLIPKDVKNSGFLFVTYSEPLPECRKPNVEVNGRLQFQKNPTHQCTKLSRRENLRFLTRNSQNRQKPTIWNLVFTLPLLILLKPRTLSLKKDTITAKIVSRLKYVEERKTLRFTFQVKNTVLHYLVRVSDTFSELMLLMNLK